ncbi:ancestral polypeptide [Helicobacter pylori]|nr:ancestral polypeptide [Helicobacter pylori]BAW53140.1 ancestral polypeptide [Helicobacter pylori]
MHQNQFKEVFERYFHGTIKFFNESFDELERALYAGDADCEADEFIKKAENLKEKAAKRLESAESDCKLAFARFGEKKLRVLSHSVSNFLDHFHRLNRSRITIEGVNMQDIQRQVSDARNLLNQSVQDL